MKKGAEIYHNTVCPVCFKSVKENKSWAHCKMHNGNICMEHCYKACVHMEKDKCMYLRGKIGKKN